MIAAWKLPATVSVDCDGAYLIFFEAIVVDQLIEQQHSARYDLVVQQSQRVLGSHKQIAICGMQQHERVAGSAMLHSTSSCVINPSLAGLIQARPCGRARCSTTTRPAIL